MNQLITASIGLLYHGRNYYLQVISPDQNDYRILITEAMAKMIAKDEELEIVKI